MKAVKTWVVASLLTGALAAQTLTFDAMPAGQAPQGWECTSEWRVENDPSAPSGKQVLSMIKNTQGLMGLPGGFNLCYDPKISLKDVNLTVRFRANTGRMDQGGGLIWRVKDAKNYYVVRFNPLEDNFRFYTVVDGGRSERASAHVALSKGWHTMRVTQSGDHFTGWLDGKLYLDVRDTTFTHAGHIGVWTKADAATSFDDLAIRQVHDRAR